MRENKAYLLNVESEKIPVYCHMELQLSLKHAEEADGRWSWRSMAKR